MIEALEIWNVSHLKIHTTPISVSVVCQTVEVIKLPIGYEIETNSFFYRL